MKIFPIIPENFADLTAEELVAFVDESVAKIDEVAAAPETFTSEDITVEALLDLGSKQVEAITAARAEIAAREALAAENEEPEGEPDPEGEEPDPAASFEALTALARETPEPAEPVVASAEATLAGEPPVPAVRHRLPPASARRRPTEESKHLTAMTASAVGLGFDLGADIPDPLTLAQMMIRKHGAMGKVAEGTREDITIGQFNWKDMYPAERQLGEDASLNEALIAAAVDQKVMRENLAARRKSGDGVLTASGGLCVPVTPYYNLQMVSVADRPVRAALPSFNADRGGLRYARPASLADVTTAVGERTAAQDAAGGSSATKTCQVVACPSFTETDVEIIYHCLQFGNLGARVFPERVAQWNQLVLAAHARTAESALLTSIDSASTAVTAATLGLGAVGDILGQILTAAAGMRSRHRMAPDAILRAMFPQWILDLVVSDTYRTQYGRWDMTPEKFIGLLRDAMIEPSFYLDGAAGKGQVYGAQGATSLIPFPTHVQWYLFPEGSFIFLDGGILELGIVRDSVLNLTNDFQIFGESFEAVAFVGIQSLAIQSTVFDSGALSLPQKVNVPITY